MKKKTLFFGMSGPEVGELQKMLNSLPTKLPHLSSDGMFGPKTGGRVREFQGDNKLAADGIVGPMTWGMLQYMLDKALSYVDLMNAIQRKRTEIVTIATNEARQGGVHAKRGNGQKDAKVGRELRMGWDKLLKYFRLAAPDRKNGGQSAFNENAIKYLWHPGQLDPMPHWCGIFALWAIKAAKVNVGTWKIGYGISAVSGFKPTVTPARGDVGYVHEPFQHHFIVTEIFVDNGILKVKTVEGNSPLDSQLIMRPPLLPRIAAGIKFYTPFQLPAPFP